MHSNINYISIYNLIMYIIILKIKINRERYNIKNIIVFISKQALIINAISFE